MSGFHREQSLNEAEHQARERIASNISNLVGGHTKLSAKAKVYTRGENRRQNTKKIVKREKLHQT